MSYPPPPGTGNSSLPPRPPPRSYPPATHSSAASSNPASSFSGFRPRQVAGPSPMTAPQIQQHPMQYQQQQSQYPMANYPGAYSHSSQPSYNSAPTNPQMIVNPFPLPHQQQQNYQHPSRRGDPRYPDLDPELQAQIAQQQSIYDPSTRQQQQGVPSTATAAKGATVVGPAAGDNEYPTATTTGAVKPKNQPTVVRQGGGQTWSDSTLLEWDPSHFRLFVGNLAGEVTDDSLLKAFSKYPSVQKARVIRDKRTTKSRGYGFVAFSDGDEYFKAAREMNGKYIGSHPVLLKRSNTEIKPVVMHKKGNRGGGDSLLGGRIEKKKKKKKKTGELERTVLG